jgi:chromosomal replication initiation ATPase DnaA
VAKKIIPAERAAIDKATRIAAKAYRVFRPLLFQRRRGPVELANARQVAMYLANCSGGVPLNRLKRHFKRDLATVVHDVRRIEDLRDDEEFDYFLTTLEEEYSA